MYFVYYNDDYYDNGGVGFETFEKLNKALEFVGERLRDSKKPNVEDYRIINGWNVELEAVERITVVREKVKA